MNTTIPKFIFNETQQAPILNKQYIKTSSELIELALCIKSNTECMQKVLNNDTKKTIEIQQTQGKIINVITSLYT
jgi:hypothetical protein